MALFVRVLLSTVLLIIVWMNSHWSVSLSLTFLFVSNELSGWLHRIRRQQFEKLAEIMDKAMSVFQKICEAKAGKPTEPACQDEHEMA